MCVHESLAWELYWMPLWGSEDEYSSLFVVLTWNDKSRFCAFERGRMADARTSCRISYL